MNRVMRKDEKKKPLIFKDKKKSKKKVEVTATADSPKHRVATKAPCMTD